MVGNQVVENQVLRPNWSQGLAAAAKHVAAAFNIRERLLEGSSVESLKLNEHLTALDRPGFCAASRRRFTRRCTYLSVQLEHMSRWYKKKKPDISRSSQLQTLSWSQKWNEGIKSSLMHTEVIWGTWAVLIETSFYKELGFSDRSFQIAEL